MPYFPPDGSNRCSCPIIRIEISEVIWDYRVFTGEIGYLDEDGYLFLIDRKKDVIKPGGYQVWPREVEAVIAMHPAVQEVCVGRMPAPPPR